MPQIDEQARPYAEALVATVKQEGSIRSPLVEAAFLQVPRHAFLDHFLRRETREGQAQMQTVSPSSYPSLDGWLQAIYTNDALITACDEADNPISSSSAPGAMADMVEAADLAPGLRVLEIGTGTGYNAALLAAIVGRHGQVWTVEVEADLASAAARRLAQMEGLNVSVQTGNGLEGYAPGAPYDRILATASTATVPLPWLQQLKPGGIIVMNLIGAMGACAFLKLVKEETGLATRGRFLHGSAFMELHEAGSYPRRKSTLIGRYIARPVTAQQACTHADFDLSALMERKLDFALQLDFPQMCFGGIYVNPTCPFLIDRATDTLLLFRPTGEGQFDLEVRGEPALWERVQATYHHWLTCGQPEITAYQVQVDAAGKQQIILPASAGASEDSAWLLGAAGA